jgi:hypothetical protein
MLCADPVMGAEQPRLEVGEYEMDDRQEIVGHFRITIFGNGLVVVAALTQSGVAAPTVRDDERARSNGALYKSTERRGASMEAVDRIFMDIEKRKCARKPEFTDCSTRP